MEAVGKGLVRILFQVGDHPDGIAIWLVISTPEDFGRLALVMDATAPYMAFLRENLNPLLRALGAAERQHLFRDVN